MRDLALLLAHLRVPFQLMLAPFVLLGALGVGAPPRLGWLLPFLAVHVGLYGGATAYNSFYDRDEGPIGFMKVPRPVTSALGVQSLVLQATSVLLLAAVHAVAGLIAAAMMAMGIAYSHPRWRWKASTWGGLSAVALGQGSFAVYLGYYALGGSGLPPEITHLSACGAAFVALGLYPITQVYQIDEDARRGDRTLPVRVGWRRALCFSFGVATLGLWLLAAGLSAYLPGGALLFLAASPIGLALVVMMWARRFERLSPRGNHDWAMGIGAGASLAFWAILVTALVGGPLGPHTASADEPGAFDDDDEPSRPAVRVWQDGDAVEIEALLDVPFGPEVVWPVVLDHDGLARYMPNVDSSLVVARHDGVVRVRQVARIRVVFKKTYHFELEYERTSEDRVDFRRVSGDLEGYSGYWSVVPRVHTGALPDTSRIIYRGHHDRGLGVPWFLGRSVIYRSIRKMMPAIRNEITDRIERGEDG